MKDLNIMLVEGNLVRDPELKETETGLPYCRFSIANHNSYKKNGEWVNDVNFMNVITWSKVAETCGRFLKKGDRIRVRGRVDQSKYTNKEGKNVTSYELSAQNVDFLPRSGKDEKDERPPETDVA